MANQQMNQDRQPKQQQQAGGRQMDQKSDQRPGQSGKGQKNQNQQRRDRH